VIVDDLLDVFGDAAEKRFAVEDRSKLATDVVEKREGFCSSEFERNGGGADGLAARRDAGASLLTLPLAWNSVTYC